MAEPRRLRYPITYEVAAPTRIAAIMAAGAKLRSGVRWLELVHATPSFGSWWNVEVMVEETIGRDDPEWPGDLAEGLDELTMAKGEAARFGL